ncbi:hypothetical protein RIF29_15603 [Crotalaria pallida]|uniref:DUF8039 domain-containing protein n=1 Tax=Crotalaria pallida TaxID=3830 RepID=A0AAN9IJ88_CROPI
MSKNQHCNRSHAHTCPTLKDLPHTHTKHTHQSPSRRHHRAPLLHCHTKHTVTPTIVATIVLHCCLLLSSSQPSLAIVHRLPLHAISSQLILNLIDQEEWDEFVARVTTTLFLEISAANRERALQADCPSRISRKGYAKLEQEILLETKSEEVSLPRHTLYRKARLDKTGNTNNEKAREKISQIDELEQSGQIIDNKSSDDLLSKALNKPDHPGRLIGVGFGISKKDYFRPKKTQKAFVEVSEYNKVVDSLQALMSRVEYLEKQNHDKRPDEVEKELDLPSPNSIKDSCPDGNLPKGISPCLLLIVDHESPVAKGHMYNIEGETLHNRALPLDHVKFLISIPLDENAPLPVEDEVGNMFTVGDAVNAFVAWPSNLIIAENPQKHDGSNRNAKGENSMHKKEPFKKPGESSRNAKGENSGHKKEPLFEKPPESNRNKGENSEHTKESIATSRKNHGKYIRT